MTVNSSPPPEALVQEGNQALANGQPAVALSCFGQALNLDSRNPDTWTQCGVALQQLGHYQGAMTANFNAQALLSNPQAQLQPLSVTIDAPQAEVSSAQAPPSTAPPTTPPQQSPQQSPQAATASDRPAALGEAPGPASPSNGLGFDNPEFWLKRAGSLVNAGAHDLAIASYDRALALTPNDYDLWNQRGMILFQIERHDQALASFSRALEINPQGYQAWHNRASVYADQKQYDAAIADYDQALAHTQNQLWPAWEDRAMCLYFVHGYQAALKGLDEGLATVVGHHPEYGRASGTFWQRKGDFQYREGKTLVAPLPAWKEAKVSYVNALEHLPVAQFPEQHLLILQSLLTVCCHLGDWHALQTMLPEGLDYLNQMLNTLTLTPQDQSQIYLQYQGLLQLQVDLEAQTDIPSAFLMADTALYDGLTRYHELFESAPPLPVPPTIEELQAQLAPETLLLSWHLSPAAITCFILSPYQPPAVIYPSSGHDPLDEQTRAIQIAQQRLQLDDWLQQWQDSVGQPAHQLDDWLQEWQDDDFDGLAPSSTGEAEPTEPELHEQLQRLASLLDISRLKADYLLGVTRLVLVPPPALQAVPLHTLFPEQLEVTYLPSAQLGLTQAPESAMAYRQLLSISPTLSTPDQPSDYLGTTDDLATELQVTRIGQHYPNLSQLIGEQTSKARVVAALKLASGQCHLTAAATEDAQDPRHSALQLTADETLVIADLLSLDLHSFSLIWLPQYQAATLQDIAVARPSMDLPGSLLLAGVSHVIYTLWPIDPLPLTLMLLQYYDTLQQHPPIRALQQSQQWLRTLTYDALQEWCAQQDASVGGSELQLAQLHPPIPVDTETMDDPWDDNNCPYRDPIHWAGYKIIGRF